MPRDRLSNGIQDYPSPFCGFLRFFWMEKIKPNGGCLLLTLGAIAYLLFIILGCVYTGEGKIPGFNKVFDWLGWFMLFPAAILILGAGFYSVYINKKLGHHDDMIASILYVISMLFMFIGGFLAIKEIGPLWLGLSFMLVPIGFLVIAILVLFGLLISTCATGIKKDWDERRGHYTVDRLRDDNNDAF